LQQNTKKKIRKLLSACILYYCHKIEVFAPKKTSTNRRGLSTIVDSVCDTK